MKTIIGIDPGISGGIAVFVKGVRAEVHKMPQTDFDLFCLLIANSAPFEDGVYCFLEQVHSMPGQGVASSFKFGEGYGKLQMALTAIGIPYERVTPQKWQKALGCLTGGDKNISKARAQELFPYIKVTHAIADALLIAEYGRRQNR